MERYLIALGSNRRHHRIGRPEKVLAAAIDAMRAAGMVVTAVAPTIASAPLGPSKRRYANSAAIIETDLAPRALLALLKRIEANMGARRGQAWSARTLDLDIILWSGGPWHDHALTIPHAAFRTRRFVLTPAARIAPSWRDPISGRTIRQLSARAA